MNSDRLLRIYEIYWQHYKLQNDCLEKRRYIFWLIESALLFGWYKTIKCDFLWLGTCSLGVFVSFSWFVVVLRIRRSIDLTTEQLELTECDLRNMVNIFKRESRDVKISLSQRLWLDTLHPIVFLLIWMILLYFISIIYIMSETYLLISFVIIILLLKVWLSFKFY